MVYIWVSGFPWLQNPKCASSACLLARLPLANCGGFSVQASKCGSSPELLCCCDLILLIDKTGGHHAVVVRCILSSVSVGEPGARCAAKQQGDTSTQCFPSKFTVPNCTLQMTCHKSGFPGRTQQSVRGFLGGLQSDWHHVSIYVMLCFSLYLFFFFLEREILHYN